MNPFMRLGILASHPIQYQAPWFRALAKELDLQVYFAHRQTAGGQADAGFDVPFNWDVDLLSGYQHFWLKNVSRSPSVNHYHGCDTPEIGGIIERGKFDAFIVCGWYLKSFLQAARACRRSGTPVFIRGDSQLGMSQSWLKRLVKEVTHRRLLRRFDGFLFVGQRNAEYLRHYGASEDRMFFVPHFVDNDWFAARATQCAPQRDQQRAVWGADANTLVTLFVGKLIKKKHGRDLLRALHHSKNKDMLAVFVGSGEMQNDLQSEARDRGVEARFEGFKNQSELPLYYASADVLVLPSTGDETWGLVVNEAMACGLPAIVSTAVGCVPDMVEEGRTGFSFPLGNIGTLAERLNCIRQREQVGHDWRPELRAKLADYSIEAAVAGTLRAFDILLPSHQIHRIS